MVVSRAAKQSRMRDTTMSYIHEQSILIERSPKAYFKKLPYEKRHVSRATLLYKVNIKQLLIPFLS